METAKLLQADYLDIIYDHRNKQYGGYELRRHYDERLKKGMLFLFSVVAALCCLSFVGSDNTNEVRRSTVTTTLTTVEIPIKQPELKVEPPKPVAPPRQPRTQIFTAPVITTDPIRPDEQMTENRNLANVVPGIANNDSGSVDIVPVITGNTNTNVVVNNTESLKPFTYVAQMPQFDGDQDAYLQKNLRYPEAARENGIEGRVLVEYVINEDGSVSDVRLARGIGGGCDEEAVRVVKAMPKWKPGKQNGKPVKVLFTLPIKFVLN
ncbi:MAG: hypothetical protein K0Q79_1815 [Flavipsychrobacter sp.]|jgi:protein TonB|nr:hypothetical protein [Flavipsychrobacter sp.]